MYFELLKGQVESLKPGQRSPVLAAQEISVPPLKALALTLAAYRFEPSGFLCLTLCDPSSDIGG